MEKTWLLRWQNRAKTRISRKTKICRQHAIFIWLVKLMLSIRNLFLHLIKITIFKNILMAYAQTCRSRGKIYSHVKNNFLYTLFIYYFVLPNRYLFKEMFLEIYRFFLKKWYSIGILQLSNVYIKNWHIYLKYVKTFWHVKT